MLSSQSIPQPASGVEIPFAFFRLAAHNRVTVIIDYDAGNLRSVQRACAEISVNALITSDPTRIASADRIIFPGVGAAAPAMKSVTRLGIDDALRSAHEDGVPILGICMGLQISLEHSEEGDQQTIGLIRGNVLKFELRSPLLKVPHMGWNEVVGQREHPILHGLEPGDEFYFVHSYYPAPWNQEHVYATSHYEDEFCCALGRGSFFGTQFHPEKSGRVGLRLLKQFSKWDGTGA